MTGYNEHGDRITIGNIAIMLFINRKVWESRLKYRPAGYGGIWICGGYERTANMLEELSVYR